MVVSRSMCGLCAPKLTAYGRNKCMLRMSVSALCMSSWQGMGVKSAPMCPLQQQSEL